MVQHLLISCPFHVISPAALPGFVLPCQLRFWQARFNSLSLINALTVPGDIVLDPMCGSGTTLLAARRNGRRGIGIEIRAENLKLAEKRLKALADSDSDDPAARKTAPPRWSKNSQELLDHSTLAEPLHIDWRRLESPPGAKLGGGGRNVFSDSIPLYCPCRWPLPVTFVAQESHHSDLTEHLA
jgi:hypothetical protein